MRDDCWPIVEVYLLTLSALAGVFRSPTNRPTRATMKKSLFFFCFFLGTKTNQRGEGKQPFPPPPKRKKRKEKNRKSRPVHFKEATVWNSPPPAAAPQFRLTTDVSYVPGLQLESEDHSLLLALEGCIDTPIWSLLPYAFAASFSSDTWRRWVLTQKMDGNGSILFCFVFCIPCFHVLTVNARFICIYNTYLIAVICVKVGGSSISVRGGNFLDFLLFESVEIFFSPPIVRVYLFSVRWLRTVWWISQDIFILFRNRKGFLPLSWRLDLIDTLGTEHPPILSEIERPPYCQRQNAPPLYYQGENAPPILPGTERPPILSGR